MVAVAEEKSPHTRKRTPKIIVGAEAMPLQLSKAQVIMVAVAEEKSPHTRKRTPKIIVGAEAAKNLTQRKIQTAKECLGLVIDNHEGPMMTALTFFSLMA
jgi:hypothetical protein